MRQEPWEVDVITAGRPWTPAKPARLNRVCNKYPGGGKKVSFSGQRGKKLCGRFEQCIQNMFCALFISDKIKDAKIIFVVGEYLSKIMRQLTFVCVCVCVCMCVCG